MAIVTLKEKGQITLPASIRKELNVQIGDIFNVEVVDGKIIMTLQKLVPAEQNQIINDEHNS